MWEVYCTRPRRSCRQCEQKNCVKRDGYPRT